MVRNILILSGLVAFANAYTTFQPNCTAPSTTVNFVSSNETRGTIDILWSCLFTIIACTWTAQHLNVPEQREDRDKGFWGDIKWALKAAWTNLKWMLVMVIAPEVSIAKSWSDIGAIKNDLENLNQLANADGVPWSRTHSLFANMGGFVIREYVPNRNYELAVVQDNPSSLTEAGLSNAMSDSQGPGGILESGPNDLQSQPAPIEKDNLQMYRVKTQPGIRPFKYDNPYHLLASDLVALRKAGFLPRLPFLTIVEINDKGKSDSFTRALAVLQIIWMISQIILRATRHLAISQIEIAVVAFSICAIIIYGINWEKPKGVQIPYTVLQYRGIIPEEVLKLIGKERRTVNSNISGFPFLFDLPITLVRGWNNHPAKYSLPGSPIPNHFTPDTQLLGIWEHTDIRQLFGFLFGGMAFGAVHITAENFAFPTLVERKLWLAASVTCTAGPLAFLLIYVSGDSVVSVTKGFLRSRTYDFLVGGLFLVVVLYVVSRLFLLVEIFRTLCFLPPSAYIATWAMNVPHIA